MDNRHWDENEPLAEGLDVLPNEAFRFPRPSEELRRSVLEQTGRLVKNRVRSRRWLVLALAAATYLCGLTTAFLLPEDEQPIAKGPVEVAEAAAEPQDLMRQSESSPMEEQVRLLTRAGDLYLSARYDAEKALACYRRALDSMSAAERATVRPEDSWLLAALKDAR